MRKYWIAVSVVVAVSDVAIATYHYASTTATPDAGNAVTQPAGTEPSSPPPAPAQNQPNAGYPFQDTSVLKPPAGAKVAIYEFEDLECPACAHAAPIVHAAAAHYKIPIERHDYPSDVSTSGASTPLSPPATCRTRSRLNSPTISAVTSSPTSPA